MYKLITILIFLLFTILAKAADISGELKRDCYFLVIRVQRNNAYQIKKAEPAAAADKE